MSPDPSVVWGKMKAQMQRTTRCGTAWVLLCMALALHVFDEATNDFLSLYNPTVHAIRERIPWLPIPTFTFPIWIGLLIAAIVCLLLLSPFAYRGSRWLRGFAYFYAIAMTANGLQHIVGSIYLHRFAPGVYSSPILIAASVNLLVALLKTRSR